MKSECKRTNLIALLRGKKTVGMNVLAETSTTFECTSIRHCYRHFVVGKHFSISQTEIMSKTSNSMNKWWQFCDQSQEPRLLSRRMNGHTGRTVSELSSCLNTELNTKEWEPDRETQSLLKVGTGEKKSISGLKEVGNMLYGFVYEILNCVCAVCLTIRLVWNRVKKTFYTTFYSYCLWTLI